MIEKWMAVTALTILGAILGSFATLLIHRLHFDESGILAGRSRCPHCRKVLKFWNLIPVFSWIFQRGMCTNCGKKISPFYPLTEGVFALCFGLFASQFYGSFALWPLLTAVFFLLVLFFYDWRFFEVDDRVAVPAIFLAGVWAFWQEGDVKLFLFGGAMGFLFYAAQYFFSKGTWVGAGDMRLGLLMGLLLGLESFLLALLLAYVVGSVVAIFLIVFKKFTRKSALPMGAFLMPSTIIFLYMGPKIVDWYWQGMVSF